MNNSPKFPDETRTPLEALRDLLDKAEMLARHIADGAATHEMGWAVYEIIEALPYDELKEAERLQEEAETRAYHEDRRAMDRRPV